MHLDVATLRDFYATPLGKIARRVLARRIRTLWPTVSGETVAGLGFGTPFLGAFRAEAGNVAAFMPASQGALIWPAGNPILSSLVEDHCLPVRDNAIDRLLVVHGLEVAERERPFLRELWRVLAPEGRLIVVVPNRRGLWTHVDSTPFGHGRPYSRPQLDALLSDALFTPLTWSTALHVPPFDRSVLIRSANAWERVGSRIFSGLGGVLVVEARKETVAPASGTRVRIKALRDLVPIR
ncbi:type 11 methyltransferase [Hyphomicrobium nitrativorans NL23]|uniref:Type 11 methyltransferase n=1 Tax=Hyphomicrobium nitrativorans NL23 TaxID=1029756 RepID=V5SC46_9HYPH|nr:class I SAM-dependent methyltransferase [Hyphomicrobium nitrativorans]AHB47600.1 type 11 methyltransferase [Hyphomicrobium nitrativorans NL23]